MGVLHGAVFLFLISRGNITRRRRVLLTFLPKERCVAFQNSCYTGQMAQNFWNEHDGARDFLLSAKASFLRIYVPHSLLFFFLSFTLHRTQSI